MFRFPHYFFLLFCLYGYVFHPPAQAATVEYDLYVRNTPVNFTGTVRPAMSINGSIPGPVLHFTEGDTAVIRVHNMMDTETSFHWHGLLVPNDQDGVPYLTSAPVKPHATHTYTFPIIRTARTGTIPTAVFRSRAGCTEPSSSTSAGTIRRAERRTPCRNTRWF